MEVSVIHVGMIANPRTTPSLTDLLGGLLRSVKWLLDVLLAAAFYQSFQTGRSLRQFFMWIGHRTMFRLLIRVVHNSDSL